METEYLYIVNVNLDKTVKKFIRWLCMFRCQSTNTRHRRSGAKHSLPVTSNLGTSLGWPTIGIDKAQVQATQHHMQGTNLRLMTSKQT